MYNFLVSLYWLLFMDVATLYISSIICFQLLYCRATSVLLIAHWWVQFNSYRLTNEGKLWLICGHPPSSLEIWWHIITFPGAGVYPWAHAVGLGIRVITVFTADVMQWGDDSSSLRLVAWEVHDDTSRQQKGTGMSLICRVTGESVRLLCSWYKAQWM